MTALSEVRTKALSFFRPPEKLTVSEWADKYAYLSAGSSHEPGKWKTLPYQKEILDCFSDPNVDKITWMKSARVGYTKVLNQVIGYYIHHDPKSILLVQPTVEDAQGYSKDELASMLADTPVLTHLISEAKSRNSESTILRKTYPGGALYLVGSNSPRGFRRISVPVVLFDEVDGYSATAGLEGDQIKLGTKRAEWFWDRKIALGSTPTVKGLSRIEISFEESDQRYYLVPCPFCDHMQTIEFRNIKWPKGKPENAELECQKCGRMIPHSKKRTMVNDGVWKATKPFKGHAGFFLWAGYSFAPNATWGKIAEEFLQCNKDPERLKTFKNTTLGQTWEDDGMQPDWAAIKNRSKPYEKGTVPYGGLLLVAGVDVQDNRLVVVVRAFGEAEQSWLVYHDEIFGSPGTQHVWNQVDVLLSRQWKHESGARLSISSMAIDSGGHHTQDVYNFVRARSPRVVAIKGASIPGKPIVGRPSNQDVNYKGKVIKSGVQLWSIGTDTAKSTFYTRLNIQEPGPGYYNFYLAEDDYFQQITAEKQVVKYSKGFPKTEWVKIATRNDYLDCEVYAYFAALRVGMVRMDWNGLRNSLTPERDAAPTKKRSKTVRSKWMGG